MSMLMSLAPTVSAIGLGLLVAVNAPAPQDTFIRVANYAFLALNTCVLVVTLAGVV